MLITRPIINTGDPLLKPDGTPHANVRVRFLIVGTDGKPTDVWDAVTHERVVGTIDVLTNAEGIFPAFSLWPNDRGNIVTQYRCHVFAPGVADFTASVPEGDLSPLSWVAFAANGVALVPAEMQQVYVQHSSANVADTMLLAEAGRWVAKTIAQIAAKLGLGSAAYTAAADYATAAQGAAADAHANQTDNPHAVTKAQLNLGAVDNIAAADMPVSTAQAAADALVLNSAKAYADANMVAVLRDRGTFDASGGAYPAVGGTGAGGAILAGNGWRVSVPGVLPGGLVMAVGDFVYALADDPGQTPANWDAIENNLDYVPENLASKNASSGYAGLTLFSLDLMNALGTIKSWITTATTAARTWTFPDKSGTVALTSDIADEFAAAHIWPQPQTGLIADLPASAGGNTAIDFALGNNLVLPQLTENTALGAPANATPGQDVTIFCQQNAAAAKTVTFHVDFVWATGSTPTVPVTLGAHFEIVGKIRPDGKYLCNIVPYGAP